MSRIYSGTVNDATGNPLPQTEIKLNISPPTTSKNPPRDYTATTTSVGYFEIFVPNEPEAGSTVTLYILPTNPPGLPPGTPPPTPITFINPLATGVYSTTLSPITPVLGGTLNLTSSWNSGEYKISSLPPESRLLLNNTITNLIGFINNNRALGYTISLDAGESQPKNYDQEATLLDDTTPNPNYGKAFDTITDPITYLGSKVVNQQPGGKYPLASLRWLSVSGAMASAFEAAGLPPQTFSPPPPKLFPYHSSPLPPVNIDNQYLLIGPTAQSGNSNRHRQEQYVRITAEATAYTNPPCSSTPESDWKYKGVSQQDKELDTPYIFGIDNGNQNIFSYGNNSTQGYQIALIKTPGGTKWPPSTPSDSIPSGNFIQCLADNVPDRFFLNEILKPEYNSDPLVNATAVEGGKAVVNMFYLSDYFICMPPNGAKTGPLPGYSDQVIQLGEYTLNMKGFLIYLLSQMTRTITSPSGLTTTFKLSHIVQGMSPRICYLDKVSGDPESNLRQEFMEYFKKNVVNLEATVQSIALNSIYLDLRAYASQLQSKLDATPGNPSATYVRDHPEIFPGSKIYIPDTMDIKKSDIANFDYKQLINNILNFSAAGYRIPDTGTISTSITNASITKSFVPIYEVRAESLTIDTSNFKIINPKNCFGLGSFGGSYTNLTTWWYRTCPPL